MKSYDETISAVLDRIRENNIENQRKRKMALKLITSLGCLCLVVAVCVGVWNIDFSALTGDEKTPVDENIPKEDVFLLSNGLSPSEDKLVGFSIPASDYGIARAAHSENIVFSELKNKVKTPFKGAGTFVYRHTECEYRTIGSKEYGDFYSSFDIYIEEETGARVEYLHGTNIITAYRKGNIERPRGGATIDEKRAKQAAKELVLKIMTEKEFSEYDEGVFSPYAGSGLYAVLYTRYINGYATDDSINVVVTPDGEAVMYNGRYVGKYDTLESKLTKEKLDAANEKLRTKIEEMNLKNLSMGISRIVTTIFGEAFIRIPTQYDTESGGTASNYTYLNIQ